MAYAPSEDSPRLALHRETLGFPRVNYIFVPPSAVVQAWDLVIPKPTPPAFVFRNCETKFRFSTLSIGVSERLINYSHWDNCKVVHGGQEFSNVHSNQDIARWGYLPINTGPDSSVGRVSAPGNGRSRVRSRAATYQSRKKMLLAAPRLVLRLTG